VLLSTLKAIYCADKLTDGPAYRNVVFMIESAEAMISTHEAILESLKDLDTPTTDSLKRLRKSTISAIGYRKRMFKSILLKVYSLERRATGSTQVYQALLTQADAHAMKFIAVLTLVFLPVTGVSTVFSSPFFNVDFDLDTTPLQIAWCFWKFWAVVAPLTLGIGVLCYLWFSFPAFFSIPHAPLTTKYWKDKRERRRKKQEKSGV
jgi:Mg2+ and Co2+ transporter CorA